MPIPLTQVITPETSSHSRLEKVINHLNKLLLTALLGLCCVLIGILIHISLLVTGKAKQIDLLTSNLVITSSNLQKASSDLESPENLKAARLIRRNLVETTGEVSRSTKHLAKLSQDLIDSQQAAAQATIETMQVLSRDTDQLSGKAGNSLDALTTDLGELKLSIESVNKAATDPRIQDSITQIDQTLVSLSALTGDVQKKIHQTFFPDPYNGRYKKLHSVYIVGRGLVQITPQANAVNQLVNGISVNVKNSGGLK